MKKGATLDPVEAEFAATCDPTKESDDDRDEYPSDPDLDLESSGVLAVTSSAVSQTSNISLVKNQAASLTNNITTPSSSKQLQKPSKSGGKKKADTTGKDRNCKKLILQFFSEFISLEHFLFKTCPLK